MYLFAARINLNWTSVQIELRILLLQQSIYALVGGPCSVMKLYWLDKSSQDDDVEVNC